VHGLPVHSFSLLFGHTEPKTTPQKVKCPLYLVNWKRPECRQWATTDAHFLVIGLFDDLDDILVL
jgi:hypothetical protein